VTRRRVEWLPGHDRLIIGTVYLLHFSRPYQHASHYVGFTTDLARRLRQHRKGSTSPLVRCAVAEGIEIFLARTWKEVTVRFEKWLHSGGHKRLICPICSGPRAFRRARIVRHPVTGIGQ
jgi:predicted GIY-YIG superfamily endonuclease